MQHAHVRELIHEEIISIKYKFRIIMTKQTVFLCKYKKSGLNVKYEKGTGDIMSFHHKCY